MLLDLLRTSAQKMAEVEQLQSEAGCSAMEVEARYGAKAGLHPLALRPA